jgi:ABC-type nitrate/sulfonate/bicarbonate transport system substrate-binding protein
MTTDPTAAQLLTTGQAKVLLDMRTEEGTRAALGGLYPAASLYADCAWVDAHKPAVQKLANALVKGLKYINSHTAAEIAQKMPADYYASGRTRSTSRRPTPRSSPTTRSSAHHGAGATDHSGAPPRAALEGGNCTIDSLIKFVTIGLPTIERHQR